MALGFPIYVVEKNAAANTVTVGTREDLLAGGCVAAETNWLCEPEPDTWTPCGAQIRYNAEPVPARVRSTGPRRLAQLAADTGWIFSANPARGIMSRSRRV